MIRSQLGNNILTESIGKGDDGVGPALLAMLCGSGERIVAVMNAFVDESGINPETPVLSVSACYGDEEAWKKFNELWKPHSDGFHALSSTHKFGLLTDAMDAAKIKAIVTSVGKSTYAEYATARFKTALGNAYAACALLCAAEVCEQIAPHKLSIVLESGQPNLEFVQGILESMMKSDDWCIAAVAKANKEDFIELHGADFVSHICSSYDKPWMQRLFDLKILKHAHLTREDIERAAPQVTRLFQIAKTARKALKRMQAEPSEFENFDRTMHKLINVPHSEIQAKLEAEKAAKGKGRKKPKPISTKDRPKAL